MKLLISKPTNKIDIKAIDKLFKEDLDSNDFIGNSNRLLRIRFFMYLIKSPENFIIIAKDEAKNLVGFAACTVNRKKYLLNFVKKNILIILINPSFYISLLRHLFSKIKNSNKIPDYDAELIYIVVSENIRGKGVGKALLSSVENEFRNRNINKYFLQVFNDNKAFSFYLKNGFEKFFTLRKKNRYKSILVKII